MNAHANARTTFYTRLLIVRRVRGRWTYGEAADAAGVSVRTVAKWVARYRDAGRDGLHDRSSAPQTVANRTPDRYVERIQQLRRRRWVAEAIAAKLRMALSTVCAILKRLRLGRLRDLDPKPTPVRYERARPGDLLHIDTKKLARFRRVGHRIHGRRNDTKTGLGYEYLHVCVDDATRLAYAEVLPDQGTEHCLAFLRRAVAWYRKRRIDVRQLMTDNGSAYVSKAHAATCAELGIEHLRTRPYTPQTNGKAERFIRTIQHEWAYARAYRTSRHRAGTLETWLRQYNHDRPHRGLDRSTPANRLRARR